VAALPGGGFLIADSSNQRIRRVDASGTMTTVAGDGAQCPGPTDACGDGGDPLAAALNTPHAVAPLPGGGFLIADTFDNRIRAVSADGSRITTVAGTGESCTPHREPCGHGGLATDAELSLPVSVQALPGGDFLVADQGQPSGDPADKLSRIRLVHDGRMLLLAGRGGWGFGGDGGPALDAGFDAVSDVAAEPDGGIVVGDGSNCRVRAIGADGTIRPLAGYGGRTPGSCIDLTAYPSVGDGGVALDASFDGVASVAPAADGSLYVVDIFDSRVRRIAPDGTISTLAGTGEQPGFNGESGAADQMRLAWPSGSSLAGEGILFTDPGNNRVRKIGLAASPPALPDPWVPGVRPPAYVAALGDVGADGTSTATVRCPSEPGHRRCDGSVHIDGAAPAAFSLPDGADADVLVDVPSPPAPGDRRDVTVTTATRQPSGDDATLAVAGSITGGRAGGGGTTTSPGAPPASTATAPSPAPASGGGEASTAVQARILIPRRVAAGDARSGGIPVWIACPAACSADVAVGSEHAPATAAAGARRVAVALPAVVARRLRSGRAARAVVVASVSRPGLMTLRARATITVAAAPGLPLATLACSAACAARTTVAPRHGRLLAAGAAALPGPGTAALVVRARSTGPTAARAIATTTLTGAGPDQTARQAVQLHR
jgi:hypothetical protein